MKIYFTASTTGKKRFRTRYQKIIKILEEMGHKVVTSFLTAKEQKEFLKKPANQVYEETKKQIEESDAVVVEIGDYTFGSFGVGWRVNYALSIQKPVLCLYPKDYDTYYISPLLKGSTSEFLTLKEYTMRSLRSIFTKFFKQVLRKQTKRINLFITPLIEEYLEWSSFHRKTSKSQLIRDLILQTIKSDKEFQKTKNH